LRNIYERRQELALLLSLGFTRKKIFIIVFTENFLLLVTGFGIGLLAAFMGILPSLFSPSFTVQGTYLVLFTIVIFLNGLCWIYIPLRSELNKPLIAVLKND
jgi:ABC-type antimicrobial peptide transport system permease subunit